MPTLTLPAFASITICAMLLVSSINAAAQSDTSQLHNNPTGTNTPSSARLQQQIPSMLSIGPLPLRWKVRPPPTPVDQLAAKCTKSGHRNCSAVFPNFDASQLVKPSGALRLYYSDATVVAPNNLYNAALQIKGSSHIVGPAHVEAKPYLEYFGKQNRQD